MTEYLNLEGHAAEAYAKDILGAPLVDIMGGVQRVTLRSPTEEEKFAVAPGMVAGDVLTFQFYQEGDPLRGYWVVQ